MNTADSAAASSESLLATHKAPLTPTTLRAAGACLLVMASYYVLRPVRDELSTEFRDEVATWWRWVAFQAVAIMPLYSLVISRAQRSGLSKRVFQVVAVIVVGFAWFSFSEGRSPEGFGRELAGSFYVAASLYPLFVVSVLWSTLSKCFAQNENKERVAWVFAAGTVGGFIGSGIVALFGDSIRPEWLLVTTASLLTLASLVLPTPPASDPGQDGAARDKSRSWGTGLLRLAKSPYLLGICAYLLLFTMGSGFLYFLQREVIYDAFPDRGDRRQVLATMELVTQLLALVGQAFVTGSLLKRLGTARVLLIVPLVSIAGFAAFGFMPTFLTFATLSVLRRASNYAFAKPARELLFTVVDDKERYQTKPFIDVGVYRMGDLAASETYEGVQKELGASASTMAFIAVPISILWMPVALWLGKQQAKRTAKAIQD